MPKLSKEARRAAAGPHKRGKPDLEQIPFGEGDVPVGSLSDEDLIKALEGNTSRITEHEEQAFHLFSVEATLKAEQERRAREVEESRTVGSPAAEDSGEFTEDLRIRAALHEPTEEIVDPELASLVSEEESGAEVGSKDAESKSD